MKNTILLCFSSFMVSCSSFTDISNATRFESEEDVYVKAYNFKANMQSLTFGDFKFATNLKEFKELNTSSPAFRDILFYAKTTDVPYEYYILYNPKRVYKKDNYVYKDTLIENSRHVVVISKSAPQSDIQFITNKLSVLQHH